MFANVESSLAVYEQLASNQRCMLHLICIPNSTGVGVKELPFNTTQRFTITLGQIQVQIWIWLDHVSVPFQEMSKESLCFPFAFLSHQILKHLFRSLLHCLIFFWSNLYQSLPDPYFSKYVTYPYIFVVTLCTTLFCSIGLLVL
jgi:hypothetical protein